MVRVSRGWSKRVIYYFRLRVERGVVWSGCERAAHLVELLGVADAALDQAPARRGGSARVARLWLARIFVPSGRAGAAGNSMTVKIRVMRSEEARRCAIKVWRDRSRRAAWS